MTPYVKALQRFLLENAGLAFDAGKLFLAESQLAPLAGERGHASIDGLIAELQMGHDAALAQRAIEAMTTHETMFFRDKMVFEQLRTVILPELLVARDASKRLRIWCAAAATGQEPYSLAMILDDEARKLQGWNIELLATDLSHQALDVARGAIYTQFEVQRGLSISYLLRYFQRQDEDWTLAEHIRARVNFRQHNLIKDFSRLGTFDLILCRNALIYFDVNAKARVMDGLVSALAPGGYLVLGATESIGSHAPELRSQPYQNSIGSKTEAQRVPLRLVAG